MRIQIILLFCIILSCLNSKKKKDPYENLLSWAINNSLGISDKLGMRYISENNKSYYAKEDIEKNEMLLEIPYKIMLNVENAFKLLNNKKLEKLYSEYKNSSFNISVDFMPARIDQSFLSYIMYLVHQKLKQFKKNKFYKYYRYLFDTFDTNFDSFPTFFDEPKLRLLQGTLALYDTARVRELYKLEINVLKENLHQDDIDYDEYMKYRTLTVSKSFNISNHSSIVPFVDMFIPDPIDYNVNFALGKDYEFQVYASRNITKGEALYIRAPYISNNKRYILYGMTYEKMNNYIETFNYPLINYQMLKQRHIKNYAFDYEFSIDLCKEKFYLDALKPYKDFALIASQNSSDLSAYKLYLDNLKFSRNNYNYVSLKHIYQRLNQKKDIENVKRILSFEKDFMDKKIIELSKFVEEFEKNLTKTEQEKNNTQIEKDNEKNSDL